MKSGGGIIAALLCSTALVLVGYEVGSRQQADTDLDRITKAESKVSTSVDDAKAARQALTEVQGKLDAQHADLERARQIASIALDQRDAAQEQLAAATSKRETALRTAARESPECADLAHLPLCPAVAQRLFGPESGAPVGSD